MRAAAAPSAAAWQQRWERAVETLGLPLFRMPSGAGHDAMKMHELMPQAMLFMRGLNAGISHNPARIDHQRRHAAVRAGVQQPARPTRRRTTLKKKPAAKHHESGPAICRDRHLGRSTLRRGSEVSAGTGARADRYAAWQQRAARRAHGRVAARFRPRSREAPGAYAGREGLRTRIDHQSDRAPRLRRWRSDHRAQCTWRRGAARRRLAARSLRCRDRGRQAVRPRRRGQQKRLCELHVRAARARIAERASQRRGRTAVHLRRGIRRPARSRLDARKQADQARLPDRRRLQLPGHHRAQRLPADGSHGARQDGARGDSPTPASMRCRAPT